MERRSLGFPFTSSTSNAEQLSTSIINSAMALAPKASSTSLLLSTCRNSRSQVPQRNDSCRFYRVADVGMRHARRITRLDLRTNQTHCSPFHQNDVLSSWEAVHRSLDKTEPHSASVDSNATTHDITQRRLGRACLSSSLEICPSPFRSNTRKAAQHTSSFIYCCLATSSVELEQSRMWCDLHRRACRALLLGTQYSQ